VGEEPRERREKGQKGVPALAVKPKIRRTLQGEGGRDKRWRENSVVGKGGRVVARVVTPQLYMTKPIVG
jgi:hypothetical protein